MAIKSTIFKAELSVSDMDRGYYATHELTIARHPSETDERMMVRVLAFALHAEEYLEFAKGISTDHEPTIWRKDFTGAVQDWIDIGLPDEKWLRKACGRSTAVTLYTYGGSAAEMWWKANEALVARLNNLAVMNIPQEASKALAKLAERNMSFSVSIQDGAILFSGDTDMVAVELHTLKSANGRVN